MDLNLCLVISSCVILSLFTDFVQCGYSLHTQKTWGDAKAFCEGRAEVMYSQSELGQWASLSTDVTFTNPKFWIGLMWSATAGEFQWTDGSSVTTDYWSPGQPDNTTDFDCVLQLTADGKWETAECTDVHDFICATGPTTTPAPITPYPRPAKRRDNNAVMFEGLLKGFACAGGLILVVAVIMHLPCCRNWVSKKELEMNRWRREAKDPEQPVMESVATVHQTY